jgi:hypothetical protein
MRRVIVPSAWSGIAAAITLAASRAIGETMIVAIAAGNEARFGFDPRQPGQTATAYIVDISKGETPARLGRLPDHLRGRRDAVRDDADHERDQPPAVAPPARRRPRVAA